jgi:hypothetical protein
LQQVRIAYRVAFMQFDQVDRTLNDPVHATGVVG